MNFYPIGLDRLSLLAIKEIFRHNDKDFENQGALRENYTVGGTDVLEINKAEKYVIVKLKNFAVNSCFALL